MTTPPRVSVVVPCYNGRRYLDACLSSVAAVDDGSLEVVVVDDGSTEPLRDVVERWAPLARYVRQPNQGPGAARNTGARESRGEYLRFLDGDDYLLPSAALAEQVALLDAHPDLGLVHGAALKVDAAGQPIGVRRARAGRAYVRAGQAELGDLLLGNYVTTSTTLVRRRVFDAAGGFPTEFNQGEDWDLWLRIAQIAAVGYVDEPVVGYRVHEASITAHYKLAAWLAVHRATLDRVFASPLFPPRHGDKRAPAEARLHASAAGIAYTGRQMPAAREHALAALRFALSGREWRFVATCAWLLARSFVPARAHQPLRRAARGYRRARLQSIS